MRLGFIIAVCVFIGDRISKWWIMDILELPKIYTVQILPIFNLTWAENRGVSFGMFAADSDMGRWALVALTSAIVLGLGFWLKSVQTRLLTCAIGLIIGGALGNIYDRAIFGYVADFLHFHVGTWSFAIFNLADCAINMGAILLVWDMFFGPKAKEKAKIEE